MSFMSEQSTSMGQLLDVVFQTIFYCVSLLRRAQIRILNHRSNSPPSIRDIPILLLYSQTVSYHRSCIQLTERPL